MKRLFLLLCLVPTALWANDYARFGIESYQAGNLPLAERFLFKAIATEYNKIPGYRKDDDRWYTREMAVYNETKPWRETLAHVYWEMGRDHVLLDYADQYLHQNQQDYWWCRVLERRGHNEYSENCWIAAGYNSRSKRATRSRLLLDVFAPDGTLFGNRPPPPIQ